MKKEEFASYSEFYQFYLKEHQDLNCKRLHFLGSLMVLGVLGWAAVSGEFLYLLLCPVAGYGCAWIGHFFFEHNKPATFRFPLRSFISDWVMFWQMLTGQISLFE